MAQSYVDDNGSVLTVPGTTVSVKVASNQSGIAASGVVTLIGEADEGASFNNESDLKNNAFGPDEFDRVQAKYGSGHIVDAFGMLAAPSNDPAVSGAVTLIRIVKTNESLAASSIMNNIAQYAELIAKREGASGNLIKYNSAAAIAESAPSIEFAFCPNNVGGSLDLQFNGGASDAVAIAARFAPSDLSSAIESASDFNLLASGGVNRAAMSVGLVGTTFAATIPAAGELLVTLQVGQVFANAPQAGDTVVIPANGEYGASALSQLGATNVGSYIATSVSNTLTNASIRMKKIDNASTAAVSGSWALITDLIAYSSINVSNKSGMDRNVLNALVGTITSTVAGANITLGSSVNYASLAKIGDHLVVPALFAGVAAGIYMVTAASANQISASRLSNGSAGASSSAAIASGAFIVKKPEIDGLSKSIELSSAASSMFRNKSTQVIHAQLNTLIISSAEYRNSFSIVKGNQSDIYSVGGEVILRIGSDNSGDTVDIDDSTIDIGANSFSFSQYKNMQDLVDKINSIAGLSASLSSPKYASFAPSSLDRGSFGAFSENGFEPARIKRDASSWSAAISVNASVSAELSGQSGLPEVFSGYKFLSGGSKAGTTSAQAIEAIDACEKLTTNFIVPLFSQDASDDISEELTELSSTYSVDSINAYLRSHVIKMSAEKLAKNRLALCSKKGSESEVKDAAGSLNSFRCSLSFQDVNSVSANGEIKRYQPWMAAACAAGMQAAAGAKGIVKKFANVSSIVNPAWFDDEVYSDKEQALLSGLLFMERVQTGGFRWVSDQMSYAIDSNFVYNSLQAVYITDLMALTIKDRFDKAIVGKSVAEISAVAAAGLLEAVLYDFLRFKWIAPSDDAPKGYKNVSVKIVGGAMPIKFEVKLAGLIYFVPVTMTVSQVSQSATI